MLALVVSAKSWKSPSREIPVPVWVTSSSAAQTSQRTSFSYCLIRTSVIESCDLFTSLSHLLLFRRVVFHILCKYLSDTCRLLLGCPLVSSFTNQVQHMAISSYRSSSQAHDHCITQYLAYLFLTNGCGRNCCENGKEEYFPKWKNLAED